MPNPLGSRDPGDFLINVPNLDRAMNSDHEKWNSRDASDLPSREMLTWQGIQNRAQVEISAAEQAKIEAQAARDDAQAIAETLAAVKIYRTYAIAQADLSNLDDGDNVEINQDETSDGLRTRYVVVSGALADKTILSTVVSVSSTTLSDTAAWEDIPALTSTPATISASLNTVAQKLAKRAKWLKDAIADFDISVLVQKTSSTGVAILPEGGDSDRPSDIPANGGLIRANNKTGGYFLEFRNRLSNTWDKLATNDFVESIKTSIENWVNGLIGFAIIYPNGGTASAPANASANSRYVTGNPFPGHPVIVVAQVYVNGVWADPGWFFATNAQSAGTRASIIMEVDQIVAQTAYSGVCTSGNAGGGGHGGSASTASAPIRVLVWKAGAL